MKTLIDVNRNVWGKVKDFATVKDISVSSTVDLLLSHALKELGYSDRKKVGRSGKT
jgi:hypothetical protein